MGLSGETNVPADLTNAVAIAAGTYQALALRRDGTVTVWGGGQFGQPNLPSGLRRVLAVATGSGHCLALLADGAVVAWGVNDGGQTNVPPDLTNAVAIAAGPGHSLALRADGRVVAWGWNDSGQCNVPASATNVVAIAGGAYHSLALRADGTVLAWGKNDSGQCNVPSTLTNAIGIAAGDLHSLAMVGSTGPGLKPQILAQPGPSSQTIAIGSTVRFNVIAVGSPPLRYQWYFGTNALPGATNAQMTLGDIQSGQSGAYSVVITNGAGAITSQPALVSAQPALDIYMTPTVNLHGDLGSAYQVEYVNAVGPTNSWVTLATVTITNQPQLYFDISGIGLPARFYRLVTSP